MKRYLPLLMIALVATLSTVAAVAATAMHQMPAELGERLAAVRSDLNDLKGDLPMYNCCIDPACNFCALTTGMCPCGDNVKTDAGVCGECLLGWAAGIGHVEGVDASQVKPMHDEMLKMMYDKFGEHFSSHEHGGQDDTAEGS